MMLNVVFLDATRGREHLVEVYSELLFGDGPTDAAIRADLLMKDGWRVEVWHATEGCKEEWPCSKG